MNLFEKQQRPFSIKLSDRVKEEIKKEFGYEYKGVYTYFIYNNDNFKSYLFSDTFSDEIQLITEAEFFGDGKELTTDEMLWEIVKYKYECNGFPYVFLTYTFDAWEIVWRNPVDFSNEKQTNASTPNEACKKALEFIKNNPKIFKK